MSVISAKTKNRIEAQGFVEIADDEIRQINYWLRLAPAICMTWTAVGVVLASPIVLWALVPFALLGGILRGHPFDVIYNHGLRHIFKTPRLPRYGLPRRFACLTASGLLMVAALGFQFGFPIIGYAVGGFMVVAAFTNVSTGFCIPSFIYGLIFGKAACEIKPKIAAN
jgi:hypothetical protein